jgi:rSAM/selenodomain-associated transferase 1
MTDLIVYLKDPVPGEVKTRLTTRYSPEQAADLYRAFILDTFQMVQTIEAERYFAAYTPIDSEERINELVPHGWNLTPQIQGDLGSRMAQSLRSSIESGADKAILIGTDIPSLPRDHVVSAIDRLDRSDIVLGPTTDGGFHLIGTRVSPPDIFANIEWSTDQVFEQTASGVQALGLELGLLPTWRDIDTPEDLDGAVTQIRASGPEAEKRLSHTLAVVDRLLS